MENKKADEALHYRFVIACHAKIVIFIAFVKLLTFKQNITYLAL